MYKKFYLKRVIDILLSVMMILILSPLLLLICIILIFDMKESFIFEQDRPGKDGKIFTIYKFKTMVSVDLNNPKSEKERITKIGCWLRSNSLDELPELFNVLKGDMSLIGPRPLLKEYLPKYSFTQLRRHEVLPGITGLAQIKGRNDLSWKNKFRYDIFYVDNITFALDIKILIKTIIIVVKKKGFRLVGEDKCF